MKITKKFIRQYDAILSRGLCKSLGDKNSYVCLEGAVSLAMGLPLSDKIDCVDPVINNLIIKLNDQNWSSLQSRAKNLRNVGIAQLGSKGNINKEQFIKIIVKKITKKMIPTLFKEIFPKNKKFIEVINNCELLGDADAAAAAAAAASDTSVTAIAAAAAAAAAAASDTGISVYAGCYGNAAAAAFCTYYVFYCIDIAPNFFPASYRYVSAVVFCAYYAASASSSSSSASSPASGIFDDVKDKYLIMLTDIILETLKLLNSPGCAFI